MLTIVVLLLGCRHAAPPPAIGERFGTRPTGLPDASWTGIVAVLYDSAAVAAGLPSLRAIELPPSVREVRLWVGGGLGYPQRRYRFTVDALSRASALRSRSWQ